MCAAPREVILGLDVGTKTIGIATSDPMGLLAHPLRTLSRKGTRTDADALVRIAAEKGAKQVVVGLPYEMDGGERRSARLARQIGEALVERGLVVHYVDERFSTREAERLLRHAAFTPERRDQVIDQVAATVILQTWLDHGPAGAGP